MGQCLHVLFVIQLMLESWNVVVDYTWVDVTVAGSQRSLITKLFIYFKQSQFEQPYSIIRNTIASETITNIRKTFSIFLNTGQNFY